jgi:cold shock CspA family protein
VTGRIRRLDFDKNYGFIQADDDGTSYFFLSSSLEMTGPRFHVLSVGNRVAFTPIDHPKGPRAIEVRVDPSSL